MEHTIRTFSAPGGGGAALTGLVIVVGCFACDVAPAVLELEPDSATAVVHYIERPIGEERYALTHTPDGGYELTAELAYLERGSRGALHGSLATDRAFGPQHFRAQGNSYRFVNVDVEVDYRTDGIQVRSLAASERFETADPSFPVRGYAPLSGRALLIAYWERSGRPEEIRAIPGRSRDVIRIEWRGVDSVYVPTGVVPLRRYSVDGVVWGREAVWLDEAGAFAAVLTRIHVLPLEAIRSDLIDALPALQAIAIRDRMEDLAAAVPTTPAVDGTFALEGVRLIDGIGGPPLDDATIVVQDGLITAVGPRAEISVPDGATIIDGTGHSALPGLWDVHGHVSQIEWARAYLQAGVTTVVDAGGEAAFLTAFRDAIEAGKGVGPRLILAGLIDGGGERGFGAVTAVTPAEGRAVVDRYHDEGFGQIKLYGSLDADVVRAITSRAHELGLTVTGHVPTGMTAEEATAAGMDGMTHLRYALQGVDLDRDLPSAIQRLARAGTVVSPAVVWGELLGRSHQTPIREFEPGIDHIAGPLALNYESASRDMTPAEVGALLDADLDLIRRMHAAGVTIAAGTDAGVPGYSLIRELELYVRAGLSPMEAIQSATVIPSRMLGMLHEVGTLERGKRADLLVVGGDPLEDVSALRDGRMIVVNGQLHDVSNLR